MKRFLTIAICAAICSIHPATISTGQFEEVGLRRAPVEETVLPLTGKRFMVIDTPKLDPKEVYVLHSEGGEWAITLAASLGVTPTDPDRPDPPEPGTPAKEGAKRLGMVLENFGLEQAMFESQLAALRMALVVPDGLDITNTNLFIQGQMKIALNDSAELWQPWTSWFLPEAVKQPTVEAYRAWVEIASESLR